MFINSQPLESKKFYFEKLKNVCALSKLFSESNIPLLYYRASENIFCQSFKAKNVSRHDIALDAAVGNIGIGIKTFIVSSSKYQKIAEFNKDRALYMRFASESKKLITQISKLYNKRISLAKNILNVNTCIFHCIIRDIGCFIIHEEPMKIIDSENIQNINTKKT